MFHKMNTPDPRPKIFLVPYYMFCLLQKKEPAWFMHMHASPNTLQIHRYELFWYSYPFMESVLGNVICVVKHKGSYY